MKTQETQKAQKAQNNFITTNNGSLVNLNNVSNIIFIDSKLRIVFNFVNNIDMQTNNGIQIVSDYRYDDYNDKTEYFNQVNKIKSVLKETNFISPFYENLNHHWVNADHVTFINTDDKRNRLIFNLANSVTRNINSDNVLVNDFVFWNHNSQEELNKSINHVISALAN